MRLPTYGGLSALEFEREEHELRLRVEGQAVVNHDAVRLGSVPDGLGLADVPEAQIVDHLASGGLVRVPEDWRAPLPGFHVYCLSRRYASPIFAVVDDVLRYRQPSVILACLWRSLGQLAVAS
jgi:DNA-binding transcriptional LysR family regulator